MHFISIDMFTFSCNQNELLQVTKIPLVTIRGGQNRVRINPIRFGADRIG